MSPQPPMTPPLDVMAVLADLQQQLTDLTGIMQAQQRTLQHLLGARDVAAALTGAGVVRPDVRRP
jgi:hypothetical protein